MPKTCKGCGQAKPPEEYHKDSRAQDGLFYVCKECSRQRRRAWYENNREHALSYAKEHVEANRPRVLEQKRAARAADPEKHRTYGRARRQENPEHVRALDKKYRERYAEERKARRAVNYAISRGKIRPPSELACSTCGDPAGHYHHHRGYAPEHRLDVVPMCVACHNKEHREDA